MSNNSTTLQPVFIKVTIAGVTSIPTVLDPSLDIIGYIRIDKITGIFPSDVNPALTVIYRDGISNAVVTESPEEIATRIQEAIRLIYYFQHTYS